MTGLPSLRTLDRGRAARLWLATEATDRRCGFDRLAELRGRLLAWKEQLLPNHPMAEAVNYPLGQWREQNAFCSDGAVPIDNNASEREMKRVVFNRKNSLFVGNPRGGRATAGRPTRQAKENAAETAALQSRPGGTAETAALQHGGDALTPSHAPAVAAAGRQAQAGSESPLSSCVREQAVCGTAH